MIPYATVEEASTALGRNLTRLETVWFDYSAEKSDYYLYCHNILFLFLIFSFVPLPLVIVESARSASGWFDRYKIQPKVSYSLSDMFRCYRDVMKMFILVVGPLQLVSYPSIQVSFSQSIDFAWIDDDRVPKIEFSVYEPVGFGIGFVCVCLTDD